MAETSYYVYSLKDPRSSPALPFYIGKGTGVRAYEHVIKPDDSLKGRRIHDIESSGREVLVTFVCEGLSELQALKIEAELISAFGTVATGGMLTNVAIPTGLIGKLSKNLVVPQGVQEKAQLGLALLKDAVFELAKANPKGISNSDAARALGLRSDYGGGVKDYLSYSILGLLMRAGKVVRDGLSRKHMAQIE